MTSSTIIRMAAALLLVATGLVGCATSAVVSPAASSASPGCAAIIVRLPRTVAGARIQRTNSQGTAAWGDPPSVVLRCGVSPLGPTTLPCITVGGVDWIDLHPSARTRTFRTFGRQPATDVTLDSRAVDPAASLDAIAASIRAALPVSGRRCS